VDVAASSTGRVFSGYGNAPKAYGFVLCQSIRCSDNFEDLILVPSSNGAGMPSPALFTGPNSGRLEETLPKE